MLAELQGTVSCKSKLQAILSHIFFSHKKTQKAENSTNWYPDHQSRI